MRWPASLTQIASPPIVVYCTLNIVQKLAAIMFHPQCIMCVAAEASWSVQAVGAAHKSAGILDRDHLAEAGRYDVEPTCHVIADEGWSSDHI